MAPEDRVGVPGMAEPPPTATGMRAALWPGHSKGSWDSCGAMHAEGHGRRAGWLGKGELEMGTGNRRGLPGRGEAFQAIMGENTSIWQVLCRGREGGVFWGLGDLLAGGDAGKVPTVVMKMSQSEVGVGRRLGKGGENTWRSWGVQVAG